MGPYMAVSKDAVLVNYNNTWEFRSLVRQVGSHQSSADLVGDLLHAVHLANVVKRLDARGKPTVQAEDLHRP
jgi:hypothetical protein